MKIISYNIHKGFNFHNTKYQLSEMKSALDDVHCDLVFLQEITGLHLENEQQAQFEFLADSLWSHYAYGKNAITTKGHHGNAILSKYPLLHWNNLNISTNRWESRGLLHGIIENPLNKSKMHVFCVHLSLLHKSRLKQFEFIKTYFADNLSPEDSIIWAGDFNDWSKDLHQQIITDLNLKESHFEIHGKHSITFPSFMPILSLDRVYTRNLKITQAQTLSDPFWKKLSDHLPLMIELEDH